jgi:ribosome-associated protein
VTSSTRTAKPSITANKAAHLAVDVASDRQATDIVLLDVHAISGFTDFMVIMSVNSVRQLDAVADTLIEEIEKAGLTIHHREGKPDSGWVLVDFGDLVLHVFSEEQREHYRLEQVWALAKQVVRVQ